MVVLRRLLLLLLVTVLGVVAIGVAGAIRAPALVSYTVDLPGSPARRAPFRIVQLSDTHAAEPFTSPARIARIVARVNALHPDAVVLTGDFIGDYAFGLGTVGADAAVAPFARLRARYGLFAVLGNHDHWYDAEAVSAALRRARISLLDNANARAGPLTIAGVDDPFTDHDDLRRALAGVPLGNPVVLLAHSPDIFPRVPGRVALTLAGHTHAGQIVLPGWGPLATASAFGTRYLHGLVRERGHDLIVSAGIGTSLLPLRIGTRPEIVLVTVR